jgi:hypothetical protein
MSSPFTSATAVVVVIASRPDQPGCLVEQEAADERDDQTIQRYLAAFRIDCSTGELLANGETEGGVRRDSGRWCGAAPSR